MSNSSLSSSLHTDSDWSDPEQSKPNSPPIPKYPKKNNNCPKESENILTVSNIPNPRTESNISSYEISSNPSINDEFVIEDDSYTKAKRISEVNQNLGKRFSVALMCYKSVTRPLETHHIEEKEEAEAEQEEVNKEFLIPERINTDDMNKSFMSHEKRERTLARQLRKLRKLKQKFDKRKKKLENSNSEIKLVEKERNILKDRLEELTQNLSGIAEARNIEQSKCLCTVF